MPGVGNVIFDGPRKDEDFGLEQVTGSPLDRYKFRSSPLRNAALQPVFFHNGAFTRLEDAVRHHLDAAYSARTYSPIRAGIAQDLRGHLADPEPMLASLDPLLMEPIRLQNGEFADLVDFVRNGLLDRRARKQTFCSLIPASVPSGMPLLDFAGCQAP